MTGTSIVSTGTTQFSSSTLQESQAPTRPKWIRRLAVFAVSLAICLASLFLFTGATTAHAATQQDAANWANSKVGQTKDIDGSYGPQCVDLIMWYYQDFWHVARVSGNGSDYAKNTLPVGWQRIPYYDGFIAQPGDVAVWTWNKWAGNLGHVGIVVSADAQGFTVVEQSSTKPISKGTSKYKESTSTFYGVIRPPTQPPLPSTSADIPNGVYNIQHQGSGKYVSTGWVNANGTETYIWDWANAADQKFTFERQSDNTYMIKSGHSGRVLDVLGIPQSKSAPVGLWEWYGGNQQKWYIVDCGSGLYKLIAKHSGQALDVRNNSSANGATIQQYPDIGGAAQHFKLISLVTGVTLDVSSKSLLAGSTFALTATVAPSNAANKALTWTSSNTAVATVDTPGKVTAVKAGTATITVTTKDGLKTATCAITVIAQVPVTGVTLNATSKTLAVGATFTLAATLAPSNATNKTVTWTSSDTSVVTVNSSGKATAVKAGTATITVTTKDGSKKATCAVTIKAAAK